MKKEVALLLQRIEQSQQIIALNRCWQLPPLQVQQTNFTELPCFIDG